MTRQAVPSVHLVPGGASWSVRLQPGDRLCLTARGDAPCASMLCFAADDPLERLNVPDTLKAQMACRIAPPMVLMSDMGRALLSVESSTVDWHDALTGHSLQDDVDSRYGATTYQSARNDWRLAARTGLLDELAKHGLGPRDLHATVNWFVKAVPAGDDRGTLTAVRDHAGAGDQVTVRADIAVLVVLSTAPHPWDSRPRWAPAAVSAAVASGPVAGEDDASRTFRAESARALALADGSLR